ncbi:MAG: hypothetical protein COA50_15915 [Flavobacteriaceae bacterium]|nr:MAG: hypothetical protein COA50_15915 [Flavobacteriaceae bacterium]
MRILAVIIFISLRCYKSATRLSHKIKWNRKAKTLIKLNGAKKLTRHQKKTIATHFRLLGIKNVSYRWYRYFAANNGMFSVEYVPEDIFYIKMQTKLNRSIFVDALWG